MSNKTSKLKSLHQEVDQLKLQLMQMKFVWHNTKQVKTLFVELVQTVRI